MTALPSSSPATRVVQIASAWFSPWVIMFGFAILARSITGGWTGPAGSAVLVLHAIHSELSHRTEKALNDLNHLKRSGWVSRRIDRGWRVDLLRKSGMELFLKGDFQKAARYLNESTLRPMPDYFSIVYLGICYQKLNRMDECLRALDRAIEYYPDRQDAYLVKGHVFLIRGEVSAASDHYREALNRAPQLGFVRVEIGDAFRWAGDVQTAEKYYREAMSTDPFDIYARVRTAETLLYIHQDRSLAAAVASDVSREAPGWIQIYDLQNRIGTWNPGDPVEYIPLRTYRLTISGTMFIPERFYFSFQRPDWKGDA